MSEEIIQGSDAWKAQRLGKVTASRVADVVAKTKTGWGASRANYAAQLVAERLTGEVAESYTNAAMQWGLDHEADAKAAYEFHRDCEIAPCGFIEHPNLNQTGASPDGFVGDDGLVEIKCPNTATHIETLKGQAVPAKYVLQMQWQMACAQRQWCDFVSFDPRMPEHLRLFIKRVARDDKVVTELSGEIIAFLVEVNDTVSELDRLYGQRAAA